MSMASLSVMYLGYLSDSINGVTAPIHLSSLSNLYGTYLVRRVHALLHVCMLKSLGQAAITHDKPTHFRRISDHVSTVYIEIGVYSVRIN